MPNADDECECECKFIQNYPQYLKQSDATRVEWVTHRADVVNGIAEERLVIKPSVGECDLSVSVSVEEEGRTLRWRNEKSSRQVSHVAGCKARRKRCNIKGVVYKERERSAATSCLQVHNRLALTVCNPLHVASAWTHTLRLQHCCIASGFSCQCTGQNDWCCHILLPSVFSLFFWGKTNKSKYSLCAKCWHFEVRVIAAAIVFHVPQLQFSAATAAALVVRQQQLQQ